MLKVWYDVQKYLKEQHTLSQYSPVWGNRFFAPGRADAAFKLWHTKGLKMVQDLYLTDSGIMMSFEELRSRFGLNRKHFLSTYSLEALFKQIKTIYLLDPHIHPWRKLW